MILLGLPYSANSEEGLVGSSFGAIADQKPTFLTPPHQAKGVPSPGISRTSAPFACKNLAILSALMAAPRQLLPAAAGSNPNSAAVLRLRDRSRMDHNTSTNPQAKRPCIFIVGLWLPLNWNKNPPPGRSTRSISRM